MTTPKTKPAPKSTPDEGCEACQKNVALLTTLQQTIAELAISITKINETVYGLAQAITDLDAEVTSQQDTYGNALRELTIALNTVGGQQQAMFNLVSEVTSQIQAAGPMGMISKMMGMKSRG